MLDVEKAGFALNSFYIPHCIRIGLAITWKTLKCGYQRLIYIRIKIIVSIDGCRIGRAHVEVSLKNVWIILGNTIITCIISQIIISIRMIKIYCCP